MTLRISDFFSYWTLSVSLAFTTRPPLHHIGEAEDKEQVWLVRQVSIAIVGSEQNALSRMDARDWAEVNRLLTTFPSLSTVELLCGNTMHAEAFQTLTANIVAKLPAVAAKVTARHDPTLEDSRELAPDLFGEGWRDWERTFDARFFGQLS